jgi:hypothetical protein
MFAHQRCCSSGRWVTMKNGRFQGLVSRPTEDPVMQPLAADPETTARAVIRPRDVPVDRGCDSCHDLVHRLAPRRTAAGGPARFEAETIGPAGTHRAERDSSIAHDVVPATFCDERPQWSRSSPPRSAPCGGAAPPVGKRRSRRLEHGSPRRAPALPSGPGRARSYGAAPCDLPYARGPARSATMTRPFPPNPRRPGPPKRTHGDGPRRSLHRRPLPRTRRCSSCEPRSAHRHAATDSQRPATPHGRTRGSVIRLPPRCRGSSGFPTSRLNDPIASRPPALAGIGAHGGT